MSKLKRMIAVIRVTIGVALEVIPASIVMALCCVIVVAGIHNACDPTLHPLVRMLAAGWALVLGFFGAVGVAVAWDAFRPYGYWDDVRARFYTARNLDNG